MLLLIASPEAIEFAHSQGWTGSVLGWTDINTYPPTLDPAIAETTRGEWVDMIVAGTSTHLRAGSLLLLGGVSVALGVYRGSKCVLLVTRRRELDWLQTAPWQSTTPMPDTRPLPTLDDFIVLLIISLAAGLSGTPMVMLPLLVATLSYAVAGVPTIAANDRRAGDVTLFAAAIAMMFGIALGDLPISNRGRMAACLAISSVLAFWALQANRRLLNDVAASRLRDREHARILWLDPLRGAQFQTKANLSAPIAVPLMRHSTKWKLVVLAAIAGWAFASIVSGAERSGKQSPNLDLLGWAVIWALVISFFRWVSFASGYDVWLMMRTRLRSPVGVSWGVMSRVSWFAAASGSAVAVTFYLLSIPPTLFLPAGLATTTALLCFHGPPRHTWHLTGAAFRQSRPRMVDKQPQQESTLGRLLAADG
ncbi:MAG: hypothetical protein AAGI46_07520 [Planctomycetota bacterium]